MVRRIILISGEEVTGDGIPTLRSRGPLVPTRGEARKCLTFGVSIADFLGTAIRLELDATTRESVLDAMVGLLQVPERSRTTLLRLLARRELLGSTAVGRGMAIPHCRSMVVPRVRMAYGRLATPLPWDSLDGEPVRHVFLIVAPPVEVSNQYLTTLGALARAARQPEFRAALDGAQSTEAVARLLTEGQ